MINADQPEMIGNASHFLQEDAREEMEGGSRSGSNSAA
jgi:hypothetical protein